jgi:hypothetical protein
MVALTVLMTGRGEKCRPAMIPRAQLFSEKQCWPLSVSLDLSTIGREKMETHWWELIDKRQSSGSRVGCPPYPFIRKEGQRMTNAHRTSHATIRHCFAASIVPLPYECKNPFTMEDSWYGELYYFLGAKSGGMKLYGWQGEGARRGFKITHPAPPFTQTRTTKLGEQIQALPFAIPCFSHDL